jgi:hypothetical protein
MWNTASASVKFAAQRMTTSDNVGYWVVYYNIISTSTNISEVSATLESKSVKNFFYCLPRAVHNHDQNFNGVDAGEGWIESPVQLMFHGTIRTMESCLLEKWVKEWVIPVHPGKELDLIQINIAFGKENALYCYFSGRVVKYFSSSDNETVTYDSTTQTVHITTPNTGIVNLVYC